MSFAVLNPGGRDPDQVFVNGAGQPGDAGHPPVNYHAYAACLRGGFFRDERRVPADAAVVLVLLRRRNLRQALSAIEWLRKPGRQIFVSLKESGTHQVAETLGDVSRWELFREICTAADGALSSTQGLVSLYRAAGALRVEFLPTPYPVDVAAWNFDVPLEKRRGIFLGTREFGIPTRNHLAAVVLADELSREFECPLAVINSEGRRGGMILKSLRRRNPLIYLVEAPLPYVNYLRLMAIHRLVWQLDASHVPGQVAGDALLCRMPCVGGNGAIDRVAFGGGDASPEAAVRRARELLSDDRAWSVAVDESQRNASTFLSFEAVAARLAALGPA
ncbi:MAG: hypothetical protein SFU53_00050 [Terrimicrobiaceae bacterium]|nr:hypothetical protein [Terrimicrobiaceae bacterium]